MLKENDEHLKQLEESYERLRERLDKKDAQIHELKDSLQAEQEKREAAEQQLLRGAGGYPMAGRAASAPMPNGPQAGFQAQPYPPQAPNPYGGPYPPQAPNPYAGQYPPQAPDPFPYQVPQQGQEPVLYPPQAPEPFPYQAPYPGSPAPYGAGMGAQYQYPAQPPRTERRRQSGGPRLPFWPKKN